MTCPIQILLALMPTNEKPTVSGKLHLNQDKFISFALDLFPSPRILNALANSKLIKLACAVASWSVGSF